MLVIIDGHNLIGKLPDISLDEADDEEKLLLKIRQYRARTGRRVIVFFDPGGGYKPAARQVKGGITVHYAPQNTTADQLIINRLLKAKNPKQIMVVSSDKRIQNVAKEVRAAVVSSSDFAQILNAQPEKADEIEDIKLSDDEVEAWLKIFEQGSG